MDGSIVSYSWSFGDGGTATGPSVSHAFANAGTYTVTLTTTDNMGAQDTDSATASVSASVTVPAAPSGLVATAASSTRINLTWTDNSSNETGFKVERASSATGPFSQIGTASAASYSDMSAPVASTSFYRVSATNTAGTSAPSNVASATTSDNVPAAPSGLVATAASSTRINLTWSDNSSNETGFKVERASSATGTFSQIGTATGASFSDTSAPVASTSFYRVSATNTAGASTPSNVASATTPDNPPAAPASLSASGVSPSQINLAWPDSSSNETGFKIERASAAAGPWTQVAVTGASTTGWSNTGLSASTTWYYRVKASNAAGDSVPSPTASATTQPAQPILPTAPSNLTASATSSSQIALGWTDNASNETGFKLERATAAAGPFTPGRHAGRERYELHGQRTDGVHRLLLQRARDDRNLRLRLLEHGERDDAGRHLGHVRAVGSVRAS